MTSARPGQVRRPRRRRVLVFGLGAFALLALAASSALDVRPRLVWNVTASAPVGLYVVRPDITPKVGDWSAITPPEALAGWLAARGYAPRGVMLVKQVAARSPSVICRDGEVILIDGGPAAVALGVDHAGRPLPRWAGCRRLSGGEVFLLNPALGSLDGRYFGPLPASAIAGSAWLVWPQKARRHAD